MRHEARAALGRVFLADVGDLEKIVRPALDPLRDERRRPLPVVRVLLGGVERQRRGRLLSLFLGDRLRGNL
jgi:hypothetical protein